MNYLKCMCLVGCALCLSCGSYESVRDTGILAQTLTDYSSVYNTKPCDIDFAFNDTESTYCDSYEARDSIRLRAIALLADYGRALEEFVTGSAFSSGDQLELILAGGNTAGWFSLNDAQMQGSTQIANATYSLINNGIKRGNLKMVIQKNNAAFQHIIQNLSADLELRQKFYGTIIKKVDEYMGLDADTDADRREALNDSGARVGYVKRNRLDNITVQLLLNRLKQDQNQINPLRESLQAVGNAHEILAKNYEKIGTGDDVAVVKLIYDNLKSIYTGIDGLSSKQQD